MNRVLFDRKDEPYHNVVHTVIIQPPDCCFTCSGRVECMVMELVYSCHIKIEWYIPRGREQQRVVAWRKFHIPNGATPDGQPLWYTDNNNGNPLERYATHLDENFKRLTGLTLEEYKEKLRV